MKRTFLNSRPFGTAIKVGALLGAITLAAAGCSTTAASPSDPPTVAAAQSASAKPATTPPDVTDCAIVTLSTPTLYACGGKVYNVYQLQHLREQALAEKAGG